jgi:hypothetical protein
MPYLLLTRQMRTLPCILHSLTVIMRRPEVVWSRHYCSIIVLHIQSYYSIQITTGGSEIEREARSVCVHCGVAKHVI